MRLTLLMTLFELDDGKTSDAEPSSLNSPRKTCGTTSRDKSSDHSPLYISIESLQDRDCETYMT